MATILLSAAGAALGAGFGGTVLGLSGAVIGRAVGATLGQVMDQRLLGAGSDTVEAGRVERFRLMGASEGAPIVQVFGRARIAGQVIWATRFQEDMTRSGGGKGAPKPNTTQYSYSVSLAVALCVGEITNVGRIWADGTEVSRDSLNLRVYSGAENQLPDPKIEAVEGSGKAPAYRGIAYVVIEDLPLGAYGNRVPQFSFEVVRPAQGEIADELIDLRRAVKGVALMPGTGEYALATMPVHFSHGPGVNRSANVNSPSGKTDLANSLEQMRDELPSCGAVSLIVSWFGGDLRCGNCAVQPKVEQATHDGVGMPWRVAGLTRGDAAEIVRQNDRPIYGGTPADQSVIEAIRAVREGGQEVMFYPFLLMDQMMGNGLSDPWTDADDQPHLPWRGRITLSQAPGRPGSPDRSAVAETEVAAFFGAVQPSDFALAGETLIYSGPAEWGYRRFILHYAHLCAAAGGVEAFCIGSEMRGLTQIRSPGDHFPAVAAFRQLAAEVRAILGPETKISYAADWSEYFGYHDVEGNVYFHLDALWADENIDFIGIDNYMPLSDWRDGEDHADAGWGAIYNLDYLVANVAGGEGFDWYYNSFEAEAVQRRTPITDGAYDEPWVFRYKDLKSWWTQSHHDRIAGVRQEVATDWVPMSKPIRFTELGCAAINKGTNQPNRFLDPKSSESSLPKYSNGTRDDFIQMQYLRALAKFWGAEENNPVSELYSAPMVDMSRAYVWAWDARPFPFFPNNSGLWSDGENYARGHWINGRTSGQALASVVAEICERSGVRSIDVSGLYGVVRGYTQGETGSARAALQPLMLAYGFEATERNGVLVFTMRDGRVKSQLSREALAEHSEQQGLIETIRSPEAENAGRVRLGFVEAEGDFEIRRAEAIFPDEKIFGVSHSEVPLLLTQAEGRGVVERWLAESRIARDTVRFALPPSALALGAGDVVAIEGARYRIDRVEQVGMQLIDAVRVEPAVYQPSDAIEGRVSVRAFVAPVPTFPIFLDLPLMTGDEVPHAPHVAVAATPWPGSVAVWSATSDAGYELNRLVAAPATIGVTQGPLFAARSGLWDRGGALRVEIFGGTLSSADQLAVLNGANAVAIGDGSSSVWEIFQFAHAELVAPGVYDVSVRLRGQAGTDGVVPAVWPAGSLIVLLNSAPRQIDLALSARGLARHYRIGSAARGYDDPAIVHQVAAFDGVGLRPYAPAHLRVGVLASGDAAVTWVRRTRIDGDSWQSPDVPLGEDREAYLVRVIQSDAIIREVEVGQAAWIYSEGLQATDGITGAYRVEVAQLSDRFGPGPFRSINVVAA